METTTAREIMSTEVLSAQEGMSVEEVLKILVNNKITGLPVVNKKNQMIGVVSEYDILVQISETKGESPEAFREKIRFTPKVESIPENTKLEKIIDLFVNAKYRRLPVTDKDDRLVGIVTRRDLMRLFFYRARLL